MKRLLLVLILSAACHGISADDNGSTLYKERYVQDFLPHFRSLADIPMKKLGASNEEIDTLSLAYTEMMADCQLQTFELMDLKYRELALDLVSKGKSILESSLSVKAKLLADIQSGTADSEDVTSKSSYAQEQLGVCHRTAIKNLETMMNRKPNLGAGYP